jgi:hypothetical protein
MKHYFEARQVRNGGWGLFRTTEDGLGLTRFRIAVYGDEHVTAWLAETLNAYSYREKCLECRAVGQPHKLDCSWSR